MWACVVVFFVVTVVIVLVGIIAVVGGVVDVVVGDAGMHFVVFDVGGGGGGWIGSVVICIGIGVICDGVVGGIDVISANIF